FHRQFAADNRPYTAFLCCRVKSWCTKYPITIAERQCRQMKIRRCKGQMLRRRASPQKTESAAGVKFGIVETVNVHRLAFGRSTIGAIIGAPSRRGAGCNACVRPERRTVNAKR